ncbi:MAG TPA: UDP-N-acetylmuramate--L-alanine ligase [Candidatus Binatia bacterium]|jgi:UDP-N-acetylmuramate: L-alanyl-gamma-D-glutamyl-meso-diaminopimelate ligase|nr:UDP-N-acetylmuramate--L-alanine ligase [Candidatus Binatia bacterium]
MKVHLIAACGVGMSALAGLLRAAGHTVTGSDENVYPPASTLLAELGIPVASGWDPARLAGVDLVVCGNAVRRTNVEAAAAEARGLRVLSFPAALAKLFLAGRRPLVVAGTHGKTTSSAMLAWVLSRTGRDPGFLIGGVPCDTGVSFALGTPPWFVVEGDEYDSAYFDKEAKFLHYRPAMLLLNAIEFDHADIYRDLEHVKSAFRKLIALLPAGAPLVACGDFPHVVDVLGGSRAAVQTFGLGDGNAWHLTDFADDGRTRVTVRERGGIVGRMTLRVPGAINARNALGALLVARETGVGWNEAVEALAEFRGVRRRQEVVSTAGDVVVIDDFAHHPTAVAGTIAALRPRYPGRRLRAVFEPRSNTSRRRVFQREFVDALAAADEVVLAAVFPKPGDPIPPEERLAPDAIVADLAARGVPARMIDGVPAIRDYLVESARPNDVIVVMSNGAFGGLPALLGASFAGRGSP